MRVICISGKAQHGKDTTAEIMKELLERCGYRVLVAHFGDLVKYVCTKFFGWNGEKDEQGRTLLQYVGTDVVRAKRPNFWVEFIIAIITLFENEWDYVLLPDCRFPNEFETFNEAGINDVSLIRIERPNFDSPLNEEQQNHLSETALDGYPASYYILNNGTKEMLFKSVVDLVSWLLK